MAKELYHHEELPPPFYMGGDETNLSAEPYEVRQSLINFTENPPAAVWEQVLNTMNKGRNSKATNFSSNSTHCPSYAAAIVELACLSPFLYL
jgi:hypothetical protein